jgi:multidrug efflux pump subunit AcrA (membrane-fusion protein)
MRSDEPRNTTGRSTERRRACCDQLALQAPQSDKHSGAVKRQKSGAKNTGKRPLRTDQVGLHAPVASAASSARNLLSSHQFRYDRYPPRSFARLTAIEAATSDNLWHFRRAAQDAQLDILKSMSSPLPIPQLATSASATAIAWQELEDLLATFGQLARSPLAPDEFYGRLLTESVRALSARGGIIWLRSTGESLRPVAQINWPAADFASTDARRAHDALLADVAGLDHAVSIAPRSIQDAAQNPTDYALLFAPVRVTANDELATIAILEIIPRGDASPGAHRGYEQFLTAAAEVAAEYHACRELAQLRGDESYRQDLLRLSSLVHRHIDLEPTAYAVANEGRRVIGCDRLSVLAQVGNSCRLLATSGTSRVERRSAAARQLERLADLVRPLGEPAYYVDGQSDALPIVTEALESHAEESHARRVAVLPIARPSDSAADLHGAPRASHLRAPIFVLIAEQFDARNGDFQRERVVEVGQLCSTALENAWQIEQLPFRWLLRPLAAAKQIITTHASRSTLIAACAAAAVAALLLIPADFLITAPGTLEPVVRHDVFAPRSGLVDEVLVMHGADVAAGQPLAKLRDPQLELDLKKVSGEMETVGRQLDSARATKSSRDVRDAGTTDLYRLSASEREFEQQLTNLQHELDLLMHERDALVVRSPIAGRVLTWDVSNRLLARPVERGEVLLTVADLSANWQLDVDVPDDRIGHVAAARAAIQHDLPVRFRLHSDDNPHIGHIQEVSTTADVNTESKTRPTPTVRATVAFDKSQLSEAEQRELRPGIAAQAEIECGRRSLGYVWLHDVWDTVTGWLRF